MAGDDNSKLPREVYVPAVPLLNERTEEVISKVMSELEDEYGLLGAPPVSDSVEVADLSSDERSSPGGPRTEEIIADVVADLDDSLREIREAVTPTRPAVPAPAASPAPSAPQSARSAPAIDESDPLEDLLRRGGLHRYLSWLLDAPRFLDEAALAGFLQATAPAGRALNPQRSLTLARRFPESPAVGWLLELAGEAAPTSPAARIAALAVHYLTRSLESQTRLGQPPRRWLLHGPIGDPRDDLSWLVNASPGLPRTLLLLDVLPGAPLELTALGGHGHTLHPATRDRASRETAMLRAASSLDRLRWVSLGAPIGDKTLTLHLRGDLDGSELSRLLFDRGNTHGLRVLGTLHAGLVVNVLALYEP